MRFLKTSILAAVSALSLMAGSAHADIIFALGNNPQQQSEENILFNGPGTISSGQIVTGRTNQSNVLVAFQSNETLVTPPAGQARVDAEDGSWNYLSVYLLNGGTFGDLIFNLNTVHGGTGTAHITVHQLNGPDAHYDLSVGNGENFLTIYAINGQRMTSVEINSNTGLTAVEIDDGRQFRISEVQGTTDVPEPLPLTLIGAGLLSMLGLRRRNSRIERA